MKEDKKFMAVIDMIRGGSGKSALDLSFMEGEDTVFERIYGNIGFTAKHYQLRETKVNSKGLRLKTRGRVRHDLYMDLAGRLTLSKEDTVQLIHDKGVRSYLTNDKAEFTIPFIWDGPYETSQPLPDLDGFSKQVMKKFKKGGLENLLGGFIDKNKGDSGGKGEGDKEGEEDEVKIKLPDFKLPF